MFNQLLLNGIIAGSIYALIALGFAVIYKTVRFFHFAHGVVYTAGAYFAYTFFNSLTPQLTNSSTLWLLSFFLPPSFQPSSA
jgi:branched-chain amino acid transport system permease protein